MGRCALLRSANSRQNRAEMNKVVARVVRVRPANARDHAHRTAVKCSTGAECAAQRGGDRTWMFQSRSNLTDHSVLLSADLTRPPPTDAVPARASWHTPRITPIGQLYLFLFSFYDGAMQRHLRKCTTGGGTSRDVCQPLRRAV